MSPEDALVKAREAGLDLVEVAATRPISKRKRWRLIRVIDHADLGGREQSPDKELAAAAESEGGDS